MREIPGYPGYYASADGLVFSMRSGETRLLSQRLHNGYRHVSVRRNDGTGKRWKEPVHKLILLAFSGKPSSGQVCRHLNGNALDNRCENLKWGSTKENVQDSIRHGTAVCLRVGEQSVAAKLTAKDISIIKGLLLQGEKQSSIAMQFNISQRHVSDIKNNKTWKWMLVG